jgi:HEPN domain-containing protein
MLPSYNRAASAKTGRDAGLTVERFRYMPPRYPNSHPEGAPFEHYGPLQSDEATRYAREIIDFASSQTA